MSAQPTTTPTTGAINIENYTQAISAIVSNLLTDLSRVSAVPASPITINTTNNNCKCSDEILRQLESISPELAVLRRDVDAIKAQDRNSSTEAIKAQPVEDRSSSSSSSSSSNKPLQQTTAPKIDLEDLLELDDPGRSVHHPETADEYNALARQYNSTLQSAHDFIAPLYNKNNQPVFGFPETLGGLVFLDSVAKTLLCDAFGLPYEEDAFSTFCGLNRAVIAFPPFDRTGSRVAYVRILGRNKRARDLAAAGNPSPQTRRAAARHNSAAREENAIHGGRIETVHDERDLVVPGLPPQQTWFASASRKDVLWMLGEYGLDVEPEGCLERFARFLGLPKGTGTDVERRVVWFL